MLGKFKGKALAVVLVTVMMFISVSPMVFNNQMGTQPQSGNKYLSTIFGSLQQYAQDHGTTVEQLTANWTADDWLRWYKYEGNPSWGSTNITDQFLATDWVKLPNSGNLTWGANYDYEYKYNSTSDQLEMWHNGTLVSYLGSDDLWHYASDRPNLTDLHHIVDKEYVDYAVASLGARYYMIGTSSGTADYKLTQLSPPSGSEDSVTKSGLADDDYIAGWISPDTSLDKIIKGVYSWYIYAEKTGGTQTLRLYWKLVERKSDNTEIVIATSAVSNEISTSKGSYIIPLTLSEDYTLADGSYVVGKLYADVSDGGSAPDIAIYFDGTSKSHWEIPANLEIFSDQFLKLDGSNANSDIDITPYNLTVNNISAFNLKSPASYIIWTDGTNYYALNGTSGLIDYNGTNATTVINNALSKGGKIFLSDGDYNITARLKIPSNTIFCGNGVTSKLILADDVNDRFICNMNKTSGNENIVVENLYIDGNKDGQSELGPNDSQGNAGCLDFWNVTNLTIRDNTIINAWAAGIETVECENVLITGNRVNNSADDCIGVNYKSSYVIVSDNIVSNAGSGKSYGAPCGIEVQDNSHNIVVIENSVKNCKNDGIQISSHPGVGACHSVAVVGNTVDGGNDGIRASGDGEQYFRDIVISSNVISDGTNNGIITQCVISPIIIGNSVSSVGSDGMYITSINSVIVGNTIYNSTGYGIRLGGSHCIVLGNVARDNDVGIAIFSDNNTIENNVCVDTSNGKTQRYGMYFYSGGDSNHVFANIAYNNTVKQIGITGVNNIFKDNIGYTTENSGSSEITGTGSDTSFTISHELAATPNQVLVTPTNSSMASATWWVSAKSSTTFTITFSSPPSSGTKLSFDWYAEA